MESIALRVGAAAMAVVAAWSLASCGHHEAATSPPRPGMTDPLHPPHRPSQVLPTNTLPLLTVGQVGHLTSTQWGLMEMRGRDLYLQYEIGGGCDADRGVYVKETAERVLVGHYVHDTSAGNSCTDELRIGYGIVRLQRPLGIRALVHTVVTVPW
jgi:hypothetical protein